MREGAKEELEDIKQSKSKNGRKVLISAICINLFFHDIRILGMLSHTILRDPA
jgi:hypothetical protein